MRKLSQFDTPAHAERLVDELLVVQIEGEVRGEAPWEVWVYNHDKMDDARETLAGFDPSASTRAGRRAQRIRDDRAQDNARAARRKVEVREGWSEGGGVPPVTIFLIAVSVLVAYQAGFSDSLTSELVQTLSIEPWLSIDFLGRVRAGEVWRLVTPMWIHFSLMHILFNMMWLWRLGREIENRHGILVLIGLVLFAQIPSGLGQYLATGPNFGGMSGVVYGLFGFVWMQSHNRGRGYQLGDDVVVIMMIWFVVCLSGIVGPVANIGHAGGLIAGLIAGIPAYLSYRRAHDEGQVFAEGGWADTRLKGGRRFVRRFVTPYAPLWFLALAAVAIVVEILGAYP